MTIRQLAGACWALRTPGPGGSHVTPVCYDGEKEALAALEDLDDTPATKGAQAVRESAACWIGTCDHHGDGSPLDGPCGELLIDEEEGYSHFRNPQEVAEWAEGNGWEPRPPDQVFCPCHGRDVKEGRAACGPGI